MHIILPVAPISKRIIETDYGKGPIRLRFRDLLYQNLRYVRNVKSDNSTQLKNLLTETVELIVGKDLYYEQREHLIHVGNNLYKAHCDMMMRHVEAQEKFTTVSAALADFMLKYKISEYDYPIDHAYRKWNHWKKNKKVKNPDFFSTDFRRRATVKCKKKHAVHHFLIPRSDEFLNILISAVAYRQKNVFNITDQKFLKYFRIYVYYMYSGKTYQEICAQMNIPRRSFFYATRRAKEYLDQYPDLKTFVTRYVA